MLSRLKLFRRAAVGEPVLGKMPKQVNEKIARQKNYFRDLVQRGYVEGFETASFYLKSDWRYVFDLAKINPKVVFFAAENVRNNLTVAKGVVTQHPNAIRYFAESVRNDPSIASIALKGDLDMWEHISDDLKSTDEIKAASALRKIWDERSSDKSHKQGAATEFESTVPESPVCVS